MMLLGRELHESKLIFYCLGDVVIQPERMWRWLTDDYATLGWVLSQPASIM